MQKSKTHYEQVPLQIVKKILEEEVQTEDVAVKPRLVKNAPFNAGIFPVRIARKVGGRS
jgi:hypothetical protein